MFRRLAAYFCVVPTLIACGSAQTSRPSLRVFDGQTERAIESEPRHPSGLTLRLHEHDEGHDAEEISLDRADDDQTLSLEEALRIALMQDPSLRMSIEGLAQSQAQMEVAQASPNPEFSATQTMVPFPWQGFNAATRQGGPPQLDLGVEIPIDYLLFGVRDAAMRAASAASQASLFDFAAVLREKILKVHETYVELQKEVARGERIRGELEFMQRVRDITERSASLGRASDVEVDRVIVAQAVVARAARLQEAEIADARLRLNRELGVHASSAELGGRQTMRALDDLHCDTLQGPRSLDVQSLWQRVSENWPELLALRMRASAAEAEAQREERAALPPLSLVLGYTHQFQQQAIGFPDADSFGFGFRVGLPVFDQNQGAIHSAQSRVRELRAQIQAMELDLRAEMESDLVRVRASFDVLQNIDRDALQAAARASTRILDAYALGGRSLLETLDVQRMLREVQAEYIDACATARIAFLRLQTVAGESLTLENVPQQSSVRTEESNP